MKFLFLISGEQKDDIDIVVQETKRLSELIKDSMEISPKDYYNKYINSLDELAKEKENIFILNIKNILEIRKSFKPNYDYYPISILLSKTSSEVKEFNHVIQYNSDNLIPIGNRLFSTLKYYDDNKYTFEKAYYLNNKIKED